MSVRTMHRISFAARVSQMALLSASGFIAQACSDSAPSDDETSAYLESYADSTSGKADESSWCNGVYVADGPRHRRVALTFDDGPNLDSTPAILDTLKQMKVPASFFITGNKVKGEAERELMLRIWVGDGHILGHRGMTGKSMKGATAAAIKDEVLKAEALLDRFHSRAADATVPYHFRFPMGVATCREVGIVEGIRKEWKPRKVGWHVDSLDWCYARSKEGRCEPSVVKTLAEEYRNDIAFYIVSELEKRGGGIVRLTDSPYAAANLVAIIEAIREAGFVFAQVDSEANYPIVNSELPELSDDKVGDLCYTDDYCNFEVSGQGGTCQLINSGAKGGFCTARCEGACLEGSMCVSTNEGLSGKCLPKCAGDSASCEAACAGFGEPGQLEPREVESYVGQSDAKPETATVCHPIE